MFYFHHKAKQTFRQKWTLYAIFSLDTTEKMQGREAKAVAPLEPCKRKRLDVHMKPTHKTQQIHSCASM